MGHRVSILLIAAGLALGAGCGPTVSGSGAKDDPETTPTPEGTATPTPAPTPYGDNPGPSVGDYVGGSSCSTSVVRPLSEQLIAELNCLAPGIVSQIPNDPQLDVGNIFDFLQTSPAVSLPEVADDRPGATMVFNSALRSLAQQFLLYEWYLDGNCGIALAASPGTSNHERGLAIDIQDTAGWRDELQAHAWDWIGSSDPVHYDFEGGGTTNILGRSVLAFQRLWNLNHPEDPIAEDGDYGPQTRARLQQAPANGFIIGSSCGASPFTGAAFAFVDERPETCGL